MLARSRAAKALDEWYYMTDARTYVEPMHHWIHKVLALLYVDS